MRKMKSSVDRIHDVAHFNNKIKLAQESNTEIWIYLYGKICLIINENIRNNVVNKVTPQSR